MITTIQPLAVGNALRVFLAPPDGTVYWRLLRKTTNTIAGPNDATALIVDENTGGGVLDTQALVNGATYWYEAFYWDGSEWNASGALSAVPNATYADASTDAFSVLLDRLRLGLAVETGRGVLTHAQGNIPVLSGPPIADQVKWPIVSVHLQSEQPTDRSIGEAGIGDELDPVTGLAQSEEGWLADVQITVIGWSLNADERITLRKVLRRLIVANLPVFDAAGMVRIDFSVSDSEDLESSNAPLYQAMCSFRCEAPIRITQSSGDFITEVTQTVTTN